jgi:NADH:ubiquinone reductase (non-electrogenic)
MVAFARSRAVQPLSRAIRARYFAAAAAKEKLVLLGCGWGGMSMLHGLDKRCFEHYDVQVISQSNYMLYTPLLPSLAVGTVEPRTIIDPIRPVVAKKLKWLPKDAKLEFIEGEVTHIDHKAKALTCTDQGPFQVPDFKVNYDKLVVAMGATTNTFGTPGADKYCQFLKSVGDGLATRAELVDLLETASVPGLSRQTQTDMLTIVVVGGGPTGVETAAEIHDFLTEDLADKYPLLKEIEVKVVVIEMADAVLNMFDKAIQQYTRQHFGKMGIDLRLQTRVKEVKEKEIVVVNVTTGDEYTIPFGLCVWASGVRPVDVTLKLAKDLQGSRSLLVDSNLRVLGAEDTIMAIGDNARIDQKLFRSRAMELFDKGDLNKDGSLSKEEIAKLSKAMRGEFPFIMDFINDMEYKVMTQEPTQISREDFEKAVVAAANQVAPLPPTAQVASQQGKYVADVLNEVAPAKLGHSGGFDPTFEYDHQGSMAYVGNESAVMGTDYGNIKGLAAMWIWRGVYWSYTVSARSKCLMIFDWLKAMTFGRDVSRL